ncbi:ABC transporter permease [Cohnella cellulosilytica]|uniref:ABC transporter permease n=1 Tax=Cohnella cellulosilytica TaxID=986710 RepID=A0ABW2F5A2_9BACL
MRTAIWAEVLKLRRSRILWISLLASAMMPTMMGLVQAGVIGTPANEIGGTQWEQYLIVLGSLISIGGIIGFGFVFSWLFGREYSDRTVKDLLALPMSRARVVTAKLFVAAVWCFLLAILAYGVACIFSGLLRFEGMTGQAVATGLSRYMATTCMVISLGAPVAWSASVGRGYLSSLGFVVLTMITAQFSGALGIAAYFPWAIPSLFSGAAGVENMHLNAVSLSIPFAIGLLGAAATLVWWRYADQK